MSHQFGRRTPTLFTGGAAVNTALAITEVRYTRAHDPGFIDCHATLEDGSEVLAFSYEQYTLTFGDELIGQRLCDAREAFRSRDITYISDVLLGGKGAGR